MGRNAGSQIFWTHAKVAGSNVFTWYCQQHASYDQIAHDNILTARATLVTHIDTPHGNIVQ